MNNVFTCQSCGAENRAGEASCSHCNTRFQYKCPRCQSVITGGDAACLRCGQPLNWLSRDTRLPANEEKQTGERRPGGPAAWLLPLAGLVLVLAAVGAGVYWVKGMIEESQRLPVTNDLSPTDKDSEFIPDLSAPKITGIALTNVNYNTVQITWITDEPANSQVIWNIKDGTPQTSDLKEALVTDHLIELISLKNKSTYYYKVRSVDAAGNESISGEKTFDIGIERGALKVEVAWSAIKTIEQQPSVFKTIINGEIKNTGESTLKVKEIAVAVTVSVSGKQGVSVVQASLDPSPPDIYPQALHKFSVEVPSRTEPVYKVEASIIEE